MKESDLLQAIADDPEDKGRLLVYSDWLEEKGRIKDADAIRRDAGQEPRYRWTVNSFLETLLPEQIRGGSWPEAFAYAGEPNGYGSANVTAALPNDKDVSLAPFKRSDVKRLIATSEGENDGPNWIAVGELNDGRFFSLSAGCDYTGWD